jgi:hypothetical protein
MKVPPALCRDRLKRRLNPIPKTMRMNGPESTARFGKMEARIGQYVWKRIHLT